MTRQRNEPGFADLGGRTPWPVRQRKLSELELLTCLNRFFFNYLTVLLLPLISLCCNVRCVGVVDLMTTWSLIISYLNVKLRFLVNKLELEMFCFRFRLLLKCHASEFASASSFFFQSASAFSKNYLLPASASSSTHLEIEVKIALFSLQVSQIYVLI